MCYFSGTTFPCGCLTMKGSEYNFCPKRGKGCKTVVFKHFEWQTFCPASRKCLKNRKKYEEGMILPKCCSRLEKSKLESLCIKCNSTPNDNHEFQRPCCADHMACVSVITGSEADVVKEFEKYLQLWPATFKTRYFRKKKDKAYNKGGHSFF